MLVEQAEEAVHAEAAAVRERFPRLEVRTDVVAGTALQVLLDAAQVARAVVVGRRDRPPAGEMVLGSTSRGLVEFAAGPVVVVPAGSVRRPER